MPTRRKNKIIPLGLCYGIPAYALSISYSLRLAFYCTQEHVITFDLFPPRSLLEVGSPTFWTDEWLEANFPHVISDFNFPSNVASAHPPSPQRKLPLTGPRPGSELEQVEQMFRGPRVTFSPPDIGACIWLEWLTSLGDEPLIKSIGSLYLDWPTAVDNLWSVWARLEAISGYSNHSFHHYRGVGHTWTNGWLS